MKVFLTSSPCGSDGKLYEKNGFSALFLASAEGARSMLFVASDPDSYKETDYYAMEMMTILNSSGLSLKSCVVLDNRNKGQVGRLIKKSDIVVLSGGHVPTQNAFFSSIPLKSLLSSYKGVVLGISAGTMNAATDVYAPPELEGEAVDPSFVRWYKGLGITKVKVIPHFQETRDLVLDGLDFFSEVVYPDSFGQTFFIFPDGTYIYKDDVKESIFGECWTVGDGRMTKIAEDGEEVFVERE